MLEGFRAKKLEKKPLGRLNKIDAIGVRHNFSQCFPDYASLFLL